MTHPTKSPYQQGQAGIQIRFISLMVLTILLGLSVSAQTAEVRLQRIDISRHPDIHLLLTVTDDKGNSILGLTEKELRIVIDDIDQDILAIESAFAGSETLAVVLMFDRSGSMRSAMAETKEAAYDFLNRMSISDEMAVISFEDEVVVDADFTNDRSQIRDSIENIQIGRDTSLFDAIIAAIGLFDQVPHTRRAIIVLSDGKDTKSRADRDQVLLKAEEKSIPIYTINLGNQADTRTLKELSKATGGHFFNAATSGELLSLYQKIADQLNNQYRLSFRTPLDLDEKFHNLKVIYMDPEGGHSEDEREYIATAGPGVPRETIAGFERTLEKQNILTGLALGGFVGLIMGLMILLLLKVFQPGLIIISIKGIGLILSAMFLGAVVGMIIVLMP